MPDLLIKCEVCHSVLDEEDLFCPNCGRDAPCGRQPGKPPADSSHVSTYNFQCASCGASMSYDASAGALRCPFCASVQMVAKPDVKTLAPKWVVPFKISRDQALATMRTWLGRGFWRPDDLSQQAAVVRMAPVYVPYWVFQAQTYTFWTADTSQTPAGASADWYPLSGEHRGTHAGLLVGASGALRPEGTAQICPFDLSPAVPPEKVDLNNAIYEQFTVPRKYARPLARRGLEQLEAQACQAAYVPGRARNVHVNVRIEDLSSEPVLLPVWIMAYRYQGKAYRFLLNGQTGRATGQAPVSFLKIAVAAAIIVIAMLLLLLVLSGLLGGGMQMRMGIEKQETPAVCCDASENRFWGQAVISD
jgi:hypothetical protein